MKKSAKCCDLILRQTYFLFASSGCFFLILFSYFPKNEILFLFVFLGAKFFFFFLFPPSTPHYYFSLFYLFLFLFLSFFLSFHFLLFFTSLWFQFLTYISLNSETQTQNFRFLWLANTIFFLHTSTLFHNAGNFFFPSNSISFLLSLLHFLRCQQGKKKDFFRCVSFCCGSVKLQTWNLQIKQISKELIISSWHVISLFNLIKIY